MGHLLLERLLARRRPMASRASLKCRDRRGSSCMRAGVVGGPLRERSGSQHTAAQLQRDASTYRCKLAPAAARGC